MEHFETNLLKIMFSFNYKTYAIQFATQGKDGVLKIG